MFSRRIAVSRAIVRQLPSSIRPSIRNLSLTSPRSQQQQHRSSGNNPHSNFYKTHGRALFKSLTLAFFSYQVFYWFWLTLETETMKDEKSRTIHGLQEEVKMLSSGKGSHVLNGEKRLLEEKGEE